MRLSSVYRRKDAASILYELLRERSEERDRFVNISHRHLPTWRKHLAWLRSKPHPIFYLILIDADCAGYVYLSAASEIGICLFRKYRGKGIGPEAVAALMKRHPRARMLANINPKNARSIALFQKLGFTLLQQTYELRA